MRTIAFTISLAALAACAAPKPAPATPVLDDSAWIAPESFALEMHGVKHRPSHATDLATAARPNHRANDHLH